MSIIAEHPSQVATGAGSNSSASITGNLTPWALALLAGMVAVLAFDRAVTSDNNARDAITKAEAAAFQAKVAASESQAQTRALIRLQASLVARGISLEEADPLINAPPKQRGTRQ
jgi:hypothetical protein